MRVRPLSGQGPACSRATRQPLAADRLALRTIGPDATDATPLLTLGAGCAA
jgi:hypothetical protein